jgi:Flp pilus assembly protein TadB
VKRERRPVLITDAERSQDDQLRAREIRYVLMMSIRAISLVTAAVLVSVHAPLLWLWIPICVLGMILIPWFAVILANDRPPKSRYRIAYRLHRERHGREEQSGALPDAEGGRVIDADE